METSADLNYGNDGMPVDSGANRLPDKPSPDTAGSTPPPSPFNPAQLRLPQNFADLAGVKRLTTTVPCRKPNRQEFVRVRPGEEWRLQTGVFEDQVQRETYLVHPELWAELASEVRAVCLVTAITRQNDLLLWSLKLPQADGRTNPWNESAVAAAKAAETRWIRITANMGAGMYNVDVAQGDLPEPEWPDLSFEQILELAFKDRFICSLDHPLVRQLRGQV